MSAGRVVRCFLGGEGGRWLAGACPLGGGLVGVAVWALLQACSRAGLDRRVRQPDWNPSGVSADDDGDGLIVP